MSSPDKPAKKEISLGTTGATASQSSDEEAGGYDPHASDGVYTMAYDLKQGKEGNQTSIWNLQSLKISQIIILSVKNGIKYMAKLFMLIKSQVSVTLLTGIIALNSWIYTDEK